MPRFVIIRIAHISRYLMDVNWAIIQFCLKRSFRIIVITYIINIMIIINFVAVRATNTIQYCI